MRRKVDPLLCELAVTDHVVRSDPWLSREGPACGVDAANHGEYLAEITTSVRRGPPSSPESTMSR